MLAVLRGGISDAVAHACGLTTSCRGPTFAHPGADKFTVVKGQETNATFNMLSSSFALPSVGVHYVTE